MDDAVLQIVEGFRRRGLKALQHAGLEKDGGGFEAQRQNGRLALQMGTESPGSGSPVPGGGQGGYELAGLRVGPAAIV